MHVAVLGGGYAGLKTARALADQLPPAVDLTLVNDGPEHLVRHEVHRAVRRPSVADSITVPLADVVDRPRIRTARVETLDPEAGRAELANGETLSYDYGAVTFGSATAYYDIDGLPANAVPLKTVADAERIRSQALAAIERGREAAEPARILVGGAGLSGIQVAGELAALAREEDATDALAVTLVERESTVAPNFPPKFRAAVERELTDRGVDVRTNTAVSRVGTDAVETDTGRIPTAATVWTGGIAGTPPLDGQRPVVRADLRLTDRTLAFGDAARVVDAHGEAVPASAAAATREATVAARNLTRLVTDDRPRLDRYTFDVPGWLVSVGDGAVAQLGPTVLTGRAAIAAKATVGAGYLTGVGAVRNAVSLVETELSV